MSSGELPAGDHQSPLGDPLDRRLLHADEPDVVAVVGLVVVRVDAHSLGGERILARTEQLGRFRVVDALADLAADELGRDLVRLRVREQVRVGRVEEEAADAVARLELLQALLRRRLEQALLAREPRVPTARLALEPAVLLVACLALTNLVGRERAVPRRDAVSGSALEDRHLRCLLGDDRQRLDGRRAGADDPDPLAPEVDGRVRPQPRVVRLAGEALEARDRRHSRDREAAGCHDQEGGGQGVAPVGCDVPAHGPLVEDGARDPRSELDVPAEVEPVGDVIQVPEDLGLRRVALAPGPLLLELARRTSTSRSCSRCRSGHRGSGSSTRCRRRPGRPRCRERTCRARAAGGACRGRTRLPRRRSRRRRQPARRRPDRSRGQDTQPGRPNGPTDGRAWRRRRLVGRARMRCRVDRASRARAGSAAGCVGRTAGTFAGVGSPSSARLNRSAYQRSS